MTIEEKIRQIMTAPGLSSTQKEQRLLALAPDRIKNLIVRYIETEPPDEEGIYLPNKLQLAATEMGIYITILRALLQLIEDDVDGKFRRNGRS